MYALEVNNLYKTFDGKVEALKGVSLAVKQGDFYALLGPNGAGKSTLIGIITSLVNKDAGDVKVFGYDLEIDNRICKSMIGVVPQEFNFNIFETVEQIIINQAGYYGIPRKIALGRMDDCLKLLDLEDKKNIQSMKLSGGMKRRLMIARALIHEPKLLILDEPTAGVDVELRRSMWAFIEKLNQKGVTIILTTHYLEEAENLCRNLTIIDKGKIIKNSSIDELLNQLDSQTLILNLKHALAKSKFSSEKNISIVNETTLEVVINENFSMNKMFNFFAKNKILIASIKNKTNRLEELFVNLVEGNNE